MTFVTSEPYIGHLGLGGVGDTKSMLESVLRDRDIKWITNAKIDRVTAEGVEVSEMNDDGTLYTADSNIAAYRYNAGGTRQPGQTTFYRPHVDGIPDQPNTVWRKLDASGGQQQGRNQQAQDHSAV